MSSGTWFAMCPGHKSVSMTVLAGELRKLKGRTVKQDEEGLVVEIGDDAEVLVTYQQDEDAKLEAAELARASDRKDKDTLATFDGRYELTWNPRHTTKVYNTLVSISSRLEKLCGAVIYDVGNRRFP